MSDKTKSNNLIDINRILRYMTFEENQLFKVIVSKKHAGFSTAYKYTLQVFQNKRLIYNNISDTNICGGHDIYDLANMTAEEIKSKNFDKKTAIKKYVDRQSYLILIVVGNYVLDRW